MKSIPEILSILEKTSSTNDKVKILKDNESILLKQYLINALDPLLNYYMIKIPAPRKYSGKSDFEFAMQAILANLSTRKLTGNMAIEFVNNILANLSEEDADAISRMIKRDLRCGVSIGLVNKAFCNLIKEYPCLLASPYDDKTQKNLKFPCIVQTKEDGGRINVIVHPQTRTIEYRSRNGKQVFIDNPYLNHEFFVLADKDHFGGESIVFDGEFLAIDSQGNTSSRTVGNGLFTKAVRGTITKDECKLIRIKLWDYIYYNNFIEGKCIIKYTEKLSVLTEILSDNDIDVDSRTLTPKFNYIYLVDTYEATNMGELQDILNDHYSRGLEGVIAKNRDMTWENRRSKFQLKFKAENTADLVVTGWNEGTGKYAGMLGSLRCESSDGKIVVNVSGWTDAQRKHLTADNTYGKIIEVLYNSKIKDKNSDVYSLFLPRVVRFREDKDIANSFDEIK